MARSRNIKPGFFENDLLAEIEPLGRLLFAGMWTIADREGRLEDRPKKIKAQILPYDSCDVDALLQSLADRGFILRYTVGETGYIQVVSWLKHQQPHIKEGPSTIPAPGEQGDSTVQTPDKHETSTEEAALIPDSLNLIPDSSNTPLPPSGSGRAKGPKLVEVGCYPPELEEAHSLWRGLLKEMQDDEIQSLFSPEKRFLAGQVGTREKTWKAWEKHLVKTVQGVRVTHADVLEAVKIWAATKQKRAREGVSLGCPMLPSLINSPDFVDAVVVAVKRRVEVAHAS